MVAQGTFDGIHLGHQAVIRTAVERARACGLPAVALTFDPLPMTVLRPGEAPAEILPLDERLERIAGLGPDVALVIPFTLGFSRVEADAFVRNVLAGLVKAREVVVGFNHTFGRGAAGTPELLRELAAPFGIRVHVVPALTVDGILVSSSSLREALRTGDVDRAASRLRNVFAGMLTDAYYRELWRIHTDPLHRYTNSPTAQELVHNLSLLEYGDGDTWWDVHPVVRPLLEERRDTLGNLNLARA